MYLECCEGNLKPEWKIDAPATFWRFREKLSEQMLQYDARERRYPEMSSCVSQRSSEERTALQREQEEDVQKTLMGNLPSRHQTLLAKLLWNKYKTRRRVRNVCTA